MDTSHPQTERVISLFRQQCYKQKEIAAQTGLSDSTISRILKPHKEALKGKSAAPVNATVAPKMTVSESILADRKHRRVSEEAEMYKSKYEALLKEYEGTEEALNAALGIVDRIKPATIARKKSKGLKGEATAVAIASDWHAGAIVKPNTVNFCNEFNPAIFEERAHNYFRNLVSLINKERGAVNIHNLLLAVIGDMIENSLHPELIEEQTMSPIEQMLLAQDTLAGGIDYLLKESDLERIIIPTAPGNHGRCHDELTEILTIDGWVSIKDVKKGDLVATYDPETLSVIYAPAIATVSFEADHGFTVKSNFSDEYISPGHKLFFDGKLTPVEEVPVISKQSQFRYAARQGFTVASQSLIDECELLTWVVSDATCVDRATTKEGADACRIQFKLSKDRKIQAVKEMLDRLAIPYTERRSVRTGVNKTTPTLICIYGQYAKRILREKLQGVKQFPANYRHLPESAIRKVIDVLVQSDARMVRDGIVDWSTTSQIDAEIIQQACITNGIPCKLSTKQHKAYFGSKKPLIHISIYPNGLTNKSDNHRVKIERIDKATMFYGVTAFYGTVITRRNGKPVLTGNTTDKMRAATNYKNSYEQLMYRSLARHYKGESRVQFQVSDSYVNYVTIYDKKIGLHHGDATRYQGGVGGLIIPLRKFFYRINQQQKIDVLVNGHWHTQFIEDDVWSNGSLVGATAYGMKLGFPPERPQQIFRLVDAEEGFTGYFPILVQKRLK